MNIFVYRECRPLLVDLWLFAGRQITNGCAGAHVSGSIGQGFWKGPDAARENLTRVLGVVLDVRGGR